MKRFFLVFCLTLFFPPLIFAEDIFYLRGYALIHNLEDEWQVFDEKYQSFVPYIAERHRNPKSMSFWLDTEKYKQYSLVFYAEADSYFFINKNLCKSIQKEGWVIIGLDSLSKKYKSKMLFCSFYDKAQRLPLKSLSICVKQKLLKNKENQNTSTQTLENLLRTKSDLKYFTIILSVVLLIIYTFLRNYSLKTFTSFFSLRSSLSTLSRKDPTIIQKPINFTNLLFLAAHSLLLGFFYVLVQSHGDFYNQPSSAVFSLNELFVFCFFNFTFILVIILLKYLILFVFGNLLGLDKIINVHFFEYLRLSMVFYTASLIFPVFLLISIPQYIFGFFNFFLYIIIGFHLLQSILTGFYIIKQIQYTSLYLFYYLCITELTPLLIGIKKLLIG